MKNIRKSDEATAAVAPDEVIVYIDGLPFTPAMLKVFKDFKPSVPPKPATREEILALLDS